MSLSKESDGDDNSLICSCCGEIIDEDDSYYELEDGSIICDSCFDGQYGICDSCGKVELSDELTYWGDSLLCRSCLSDALPDLEYDQEENEEETTEAFEEMKSRYLGKMTWDLETGPNLLSYVDGSYDTDLRYEITVTIDEDSRIIDISRLTAEALLSESATSSDWRPCPIDEDDYETIVDEILEEYIDDEDEDEED